MVGKCNLFKYVVNARLTMRLLTIICERVVMYNSFILQDAKHLRFVMLNLQTSNTHASSGS